MNITERIADVLLGHKSAIRGCECGYEADIDYYEHLTEVLVAELGLAPEERWAPIDESGERWEPRSESDARAVAMRYPPVRMVPGCDLEFGITHVLHERRYVTDWWSE